MVQGLPSDVGVTGLADGRHLVFLEGVAPDGSTITADLGIWFSGEEANQAATEDGQSDVPVPNDYYIRNLDPGTIDVSVAPAVAVTSAWWAYEQTQSLEPVPVPYADWVAFFVGGADSASPRDNLRFDPWWVTVEDGSVVALDEQYIP
jgi:hypothetical protein